MTRPYTWILFDIGNVVVRVTDQGLISLAESFGVSPAILQAFLQESGLQANANVGAISPADYVSRINHRFAGSLTVAAVIDALAQDVQTPMPGIQQVLRRLRGQYRLGALSDTFFAHWETFKRTPLAAEFDQLLASHEIGIMKTDPAAFPKALSLLNAAPAEVLFVDDLAVNVANARKSGIPAFRAVSPQELLAGLESAGVSLRSASAPSDR